MNIDEKCKQCTAICCNYVVKPLPAPTTRHAAYEFLWFILHKDVYVNIKNIVEDSKHWVIKFDTPCEKLTEDNMCSIHRDKPWVCRDYPGNQPCHFDKEDLQDEPIWCGNYDEAKKVIDKLYQYRR